MPAGIEVREKKEGKVLKNLWLFQFREYLCTLKKRGAGAPNSLKIC
jgi:hypothetical protein